ncbi:MAG: DNA-binding transcriptional regulator [Deltaproteobacteria bacterium]|nr:DNA-binding transcriptional regulator [Deltaproteobacteria bacterium]
MSERADNILAVVHETAKGLYDAGIMNETTMREFDALCLTPVRAYKPEEIKQIRMRYRVSQAVFAAYLNVSKTSVAGWESGGKRPGPAAVKLLNLVDRKGIEAVA